MTKTFMLDGKPVPFRDGQTIIEAATEAGVYIPHLCHHPEFTPHGSCKLCSVLVNGRVCTACTFPAAVGLEVQSHSDELNEDRKRITQMLFVEGNHLCPGCEKSGNCKLQAVGYYLGMLDNHFVHFFSPRKLDASHPDVLIDLNRCIFCTLCVRASREKDGKDVFAISGRGINKHLISNSASGLLKDTDLEATDQAAHICPTGAILIKRTGYTTPIGARDYDRQTIAEASLEAESCSLPDSALPPSLAVAGEKDRNDG
jgi:[NiFe] hydrogenase diaphorase moiety small subunit